MSLSHRFIVKLKKVIKNMVKTTSGSIVCETTTMFSVFDGRRQLFGSIFFKNVKMHKHMLFYTAFMLLL